MQILFVSPLPLSKQKLHGVLKQLFVVVNFLLLPFFMDICQKYIMSGVLHHLSLLQDIFLSYII